MFQDWSETLEILLWRFPFLDIRHLQPKIAPQFLREGEICSQILARVV